MARIRTIKPEFWRNEGLSSISAEAALLAIGLLNISDDDGYFWLNEKLITADIFLLRELYRAPTVLLRELYEIGYIDTFKGADGRIYGHVRNFNVHQVINKKKKSKIKDLDLVPYEYGTSTVEVPAERKGKEEKEELEVIKEVKEVKKVSKKKIEKKEIEVLEVLEVPPWIDQETWKDFLRMRIEMKKPLSAVAAKLIINDLNKWRGEGDDPNECLRESIKSNWRGVFRKHAVRSVGKKYDAAAAMRELLESERNAQDAADDLFRAARPIWDDGGGN